MLALTEIVLVGGEGGGVYGQGVLYGYEAVDE